MSLVYVCAHREEIPFNPLTNTTLKAVEYRETVTMAASGHQIPLKSHKPWWRGWGGGEVTDRSARGVSWVITLLCAFTHIKSIQRHTHHSLVWSVDVSRVPFSLLTVTVSSVFCHLIRSSITALHFHALSSNNFPFSSTPFSGALGLSICLSFSHFFLCQNS